MTIPLRTDEIERLAALSRYQVLDTPREPDFDNIAALASEICAAPIAVVNLVGEGRQFFKAEVGLGVRETPLENSFCGHAILAEDFMMVPDATQDPRFEGNPLVAGAPGLRFYAGALLKTTEGLPLGTLCVLDFQPRRLDEHQQNALRILAGQVMGQLELRRALATVSELNDQLMARIAEVEVERDRSTMLGREIDHRVMNSLQFVSGLLAMQARSAKTAEAAQQLEVASSRVNAVARVHRHFYAEESVGKVPALAYVQRLMADMTGVLDPCQVAVEGEETPIDTRLVMALGLIVNELASNAAKHGARRVVLKIAPWNEGLRLTVSDDGPGLPASFDPKARVGLGMRVVQSLVKQHDGTLAHGRGAAGGAEFVVSLASPG